MPDFHDQRSALVSIVAIFASSLGRRLHSSAVASKRLRRVNGILFILLGLKLATAKLNS